MNLQPTLENILIKLSPLKEEDFEPLFEIASDPLIWEQNPTKDRYKREVFQEYFDRGIESKGAFFVTDNQTKKPIGSTRFYEYDPENKRVAIGYTFLIRDYWGGNHNRAMKSMLMYHAFLFVDTVRYHVGANNIRSQKALQKLGIRKIGEQLRNGAPYFEYETTKEEFNQVGN